MLLACALLAFADDPAPEPPAATEAASMDDGADLDAEEGHLAASVVSDVLKKNNWAFTDCYSRLGGSTRGRALATWDVSLTGAAQNVKLTESDLKNPPFEACLVKAIGRMKFPEPGAGVVHLTHTLNF